MEEKLNILLNNSYAIYSHFRVSAILKTYDNKEFVGVNIENSSYGATICAERVAIFNAIANGYKKEDFKELHIMSEKNKIIVPCMICRQVFVELLPDNIKIFCYSKNDVSSYTKQKLCPNAFSKEYLK